LFYRVFASRNLVLVAACAIFLMLPLWTPLAILVGLTSALAVFDMAVLSSEGVSPPAFHAVTLGGDPGDDGAVGAKSDGGEGIGGSPDNLFKIVR
jgi:hypothetical protein